MSFMLRHPAWVVIFALNVFIAIALPVQHHRLQAARAQATAAQLRESNLQAEQDSTRNVALENARVARMLGDSLRMVQKRVVQVAQVRDALDGALGVERRARYQLSARIDSLTSVVRAPVVVGADVRRAQFTMRKPPYTVAADVQMPAPPGEARIAIRVALDSIPITARVECSRTDSLGVRAARLVASAPAWARLRLARLEQAPEICTAPPPRRAPFLAFKKLVVGFGVSGRASGTVTWGWFVGTGLAIRI